MNTGRGPERQLRAGSYLGSEGHVVVIETAVILRVALLLATPAEEGHFVGDDLDAVALDVLAVRVAGVVDAAPDHDLLALVDVLGDGLADAVEAGDAVPFGVLDPATIGVLEDLALAVALGARGGEAELGDLGAALSGADFGGWRRRCRRG